jgi:hypothetical protein
MRTALQKAIDKRRVLARRRPSRRLPDQAAIGCARIVREEEEGGGGKEGGGTRVGAVPEVGSFNAITRESKVWALGLTPPFGHLLWAARSAVACPGCPWCGAAWHGAARFSPDGGPPRQHPAAGVRGSIPRVGSPRQGGPSPAAGIRPRAEAPRRQPADTADADAATPPPTPPPTTPTTYTPSPPRPSPSPPPPAMESRHCRRRRRRRQRSR